MASPAVWWQNPVTQGFNPPIEPGVDIGTPFHSLITALAPGTVISESFGGFGARIDIKTSKGITEYYQHLDTILSGLKVGSKVELGQALGLSGGQLSGGSRPNSPANSSGPHVEFGAYSGDKTPLDPYLAEPSLLAKLLPTLNGGPALPGGFDQFGHADPGAFDPTFGVAGAIAGIPTTIGHGLADFFVVAEQDIAEWLKRQSVAFFVAAIVLLVLFA